VRKLLQLFGFYGDEYEDRESGYSDYYEEEPQSRSARKDTVRKTNEPRSKPVSPKLVFFRGIPPEGIKLKLRDYLLDGAMILLDINDLEAEYIEEGRNFINFMRGVAFAHRGESRNIGLDRSDCLGLYVITPREGMLQCWGEEE